MGWQLVSKEDFVLWKPDMRLEKKKNLVSRVKNVTWQLVSRVQKCDLATSFQGRFCALETRYEIRKKKNLVSRVKNATWQLVSKEDFVLWKPDVRLGKEKSGFQSQGC